MKKVLLSLILIIFPAWLWSAYGFYKIARIESGEERNIPGRNPEEIWQSVLLFDDSNKPIVKIMSRVDLKRYRVKICRYIKNLTSTTVRFMTVFELRYILHQPFKTVIAKNGEIRPTCKEIIIGGIYHRLDWGVAVYKEWLSANEKAGKGIIEHW